MTMFFIEKMEMKVLVKKFLIARKILVVNVIEALQTIVFVKINSDRAEQRAA